MATTPRPEEPFIEVRANKLGQLGQAEWYHLYVVYHDGKGNQCFLRGGPSTHPGGDTGRNISELSGGASNSASVQTSASLTFGFSRGSGSNPASLSDKQPNGPYGSIQTEVRWLDNQPGSRLPIDYHPEHNVYKSIVAARGPECEHKFRMMCDAMIRIEATNTRYSPLGPNSNTCVTTSLRAAGIDSKLPEGVIAPGAEQHIDTSKVTRMQMSAVARDGDHESPAAKSGGNVRQAAAPGQSDAAETRRSLRDQIRGSTENTPSQSQDRDRG